MPPMTTMFQQVGIIGALLAGVAYLPQIVHMVKEQCTYGISLKAFGLWLLAAILITIHAVAIGAIAFILLGVIQITACTIIVLYCSTHKGMVCAFHAKRRR